MSISKAQRRCISHLLRNLLEGVSGVLSMVENETFNVKAEDLATVLEGTPATLSRVIECLKCGSFCIMSGAECKLVRKYVKCKMPVMLKKFNGPEPRKLPLSTLGNKSTHKIS